MAINKQYLIYKDEFELTGLIRAAEEHLDGWIQKQFNSTDVIKVKLVGAQYESVVNALRLRYMNQGWKVEVAQVNDYFEFSFS